MIYKLFLRLEWGKMEQIKFELGEQEFITLVNLLKTTDVVSSGGEVKILLINELITYNGEIEYRKKKKVFSGDIITVNEEITITVS